MDCVGYVFDMWITTTHVLFAYFCKSVKIAQLCAGQTSLVEELPGVLATESYVARDGPHQLDDVGQVVLISGVVLSAVGLKQIVSRR